MSAAEDKTGKDRMGRNVLSSWGGHFVYILAGFVLPRMIDRNIGQAALGVWDFSWSMVSYFGVAGLGIGSSVNRNVATYRAAGRFDDLRHAVSSVCAIQIVISFVILLFSFVAYRLTPVLFVKRLGAEVGDASHVVLLLGTALSVQMALDTSRGIMTGCHRWDLHNGINAGSHALTVVTMGVVLYAGGGIRSLATVYLVFTVFTESFRTFLSHRICPEAVIRPSSFSRTHAREMFLFGVKTVITGLPSLFLVQGSSLMVGMWMGAAALAVYSRPLGLIRNSQTFINKFAFVLTPTVASIQETGRPEELRDLMISATRVSAAIALPILLVLTIQGDLLLRLWMGNRYEQHWLVSILAVGHFLPMTQQPVMTILIGMNRHGRLGLLALAFAVGGLLLGIVHSYVFPFTYITAAAMVAISYTLGAGLFVMWNGCTAVGIPVSRYVSQTFFAPMLCASPLALALLASRAAFAQAPFTALAAGTFFGLLGSLPLFARYVFRDHFRALRARFRTSREPA